MISLVGVYLGLQSHDLSPSTKQYVLVFVAGNFMYIASDIWKTLMQNENKIMDFVEMGAVFVGVYVTLLQGCNH